ncbi:MAG TPA: aminotransferase class V-fold PLP-dependent enzyme [Flavobacterium sp.]
MKSEFLLDPSITYLNHGSFGACPKPIFEDYQKWQLELEREPVQFILKNGVNYLKESKSALARYVNCDPADFFFTANPTLAINTVMRSLDLKPGDEILATNHEYGAMDRTWNFYCKKTGARYIRQNISLPIKSREQILENFWKGYNKNTRAIFINEISSVTALIFPVKEICERAKELGLITIVDGAHVPGHIALDLGELKADFYTGTLHKWMLTPKGCSFLYVSKEYQDKLEPLVVSWGYESEAASESRFLDYHEQQGTRDISAFLTAPKAIEFLQANDWDLRSAECRKLVRDNYKRFCDLLNTQPICPVTEEFLGQMCSIPITTSSPIALKELLFEKYRIEIPVMSLDGTAYLRFSIQVYNSQLDLDLLYEAIKDIQATTTLLSV